SGFSFLQQGFDSPTGYDLSVGKTIISFKSKRW
ncbi:uncharacterized protein METZ01_LOCUS454968, partial [marine metagenome]